MDPTLARAVEARIAAATGESVAIVGSRPLGGGCIHDARLASLAGGGRLFVKSSRDAPPDLFESEAAGLRALAATKAVRVPARAVAGETADGRTFVAMEAIATGRPFPGFDEELGRSLAELHRRGRGKRFGFEVMTYCGATPQPNTFGDEWIGFFRERRLGHLLGLARARGLADPELERLGERLLDRLDDVLAGPVEPPCLVHGDLWSGNVLAGEDGAPALVDPAVFYAHREHELGMTRLFGNFGPRFETAYREAWPLSRGADRRIEVYRLYHLLNHLVLFGKSYRDGCLGVLRKLVG